MRKFLTMSLLGLALAASPALADGLDNRLNSALDDLDAAFAGHESVLETASNGARYKYLIVDMRFAEPRPEPQVQASVDRICRAILLNRPLLETLNDQGFQMVAVAFNRDYQYDCL